MRPARKTAKARTKKSDRAREDRSSKSTRDAEPTTILDGNAPVEVAELRARDLPDKMFLVRMAPSGWSCLTRDLLERLTKEGKSALTLASVLPTQRLPFLYPDLPLDSALRHVSQAELIPVVNRADLRMLEGVVTRDDVLSRYQADAVAD